MVIRVLLVFAAGWIITLKEDVVVWFGVGFSWKDFFRWPSSKARSVSRWRRGARRGPNVGTGTLVVPSSMLPSGMCGS